MKEGNGNENLIESLHKLIQEKKDIDRISWDNIGDLIGYSGVGVKKALKNKGLSITKLEVIIVKLNLIDDAKNLGLNLSSKKIKQDNGKGLMAIKLKNNNLLKSEKDIDLLESICLSNWDSLIKRGNFMAKVELTTMKDINRVLDERLAEILKNMNAKK